MLLPKQKASMKFMSALPVKRLVRIKRLMYPLSSKQARKNSTDMIIPPARVQAIIQLSPASPTYRPTGVKGLIAVIIRTHTTGSMIHAFIVRRAIRTSSVKMKRPVRLMSNVARPTNTLLSKTGAMTAPAALSAKAKKSSVA